MKNLLGMKNIGFQCFLKIISSHFWGDLRATRHGSCFKDCQQVYDAERHETHFSISINFMSLHQTHKIDKNFSFLIRRNSSEKLKVLTAFTVFIRPNPFHLKMPSQHMEGIRKKIKTILGKYLFPPWKSLAARNFCGRKDRRYLWDVSCGGFGNYVAIWAKTIWVITPKVKGQPWMNKFARFYVLTRKEGTKTTDSSSRRKIDLVNSELHQQTKLKEIIK